MLHSACRPLHDPGHYQRPHFLCSSLTCVCVKETGTAGEARVSVSLAKPCTRLVSPMWLPTMAVHLGCPPWPPAFEESPGELGSSLPLLPHQGHEVGSSLSVFCDLAPDQRDPRQPSDVPQSLLRQVGRLFVVIYPLHRGSWLAYLAGVE